MFKLAASASGSSITPKFNDKAVEGAYGPAGVKVAQRIVEILSTHLPDCSIELTFKAVESDSYNAHFALGEAAIDEATIQRITDLFGEHFGKDADEGYRPVLIHSDTGHSILLEPIQTD